MIVVLAIRKNEREKYSGFKSEGSDDLKSLQFINIPIGR